jgi:phage shock protein B
MGPGEAIAVPIVVLVLFIGLPWLIFHYITKWKTAATLTGSDEKLLDDLYETARRLDDRLCSIERIMAADDPNWRAKCAPDAPRLTDTAGEMDLDAELARLSARTRERETR